MASILDVTAAGEADDWQTVDDWVLPQEVAPRRRIGNPGIAAVEGLQPQLRPLPGTEYQPPAPATSIAEERRAANAETPVPGRTYAEMPLPPPEPDPLQAQAEAPVDLAPLTPLSLRQTRVDQGIARLGRVPDRGDALLEAGGLPDMGDPASYGGQGITYAEMGSAERAGEQFRSGLETRTQGSAVTSIDGTLRALRDADAADAGGESAPDSPIPWSALTPEQRQQQRGILERSLGSQVQRWLSSRDRAAEMARNPAIEPLARAADAGAWGDVWRILASDPGGILQQLSVESLPMQIAPMALGVGGAVTAGRIGAALGQFLGGYSEDAGPRMLELLTKRMQESGVDARDDAAVTAWLRANQPFVQEASQAAQRGAYMPGLADAASAGLARPMRAGEGAWRTARTGARNLALEIGTEGLGEGAAGIAAAGQVSPSEVLFEMLGAGPQAAGTTALATMTDRAPAAAPPGISTPSAPDQGAAAVSPAAPPGGGPAAGAAQPQAAPPTAPTDDWVPDVEVTTTAAAPPPPTPNNTRPSLAAALNDPEDPMARRERERLERESAAQEAEFAAGQQEAAAAQRQRAIDAFTATLPEGWTVQPEGEASYVLDPNGDAFGMVDGLEPDALARLGQQAQQQHQAGVQNGTYAPPPPVGDGTRAGSLDDRLNALSAEARALEDAGPRIPESQMPLYRVLRSASSSAVLSRTDAARAIVWALQNDRRDIADAIRDRMLSAAARPVTIPGVPETHPKYAAIQADLEQRAQERRDDAEAILRVMEFASTTLEPIQGDGTPQAPIVATQPGAVNLAAAATNTAPTPAQAQAGNYAQGRVRLHGMDIAIETPRGAERRGTDPDGNAWSVTMPDHYGRIRGTKGADGDEVDAYLGPQAEDASLPVYVIDQMDPRTGRFDEHKTFVGYPTREAAVAAYDAAFSDGSGPRRRAGVTEEPTIGAFRMWLATGETSPRDRAGATAWTKARRAEKAQEKAQEEAAKGDISSIGSGLAGAMGESLRVALWEGYSANTGAMRNDLYVRAARHIAEKRGTSLSREEFSAFTEEFARAEQGDERRAVIEKWAPAAPPPAAAQPPAPKPEPDRPTITFSKARLIPTRGPDGRVVYVAEPIAEEQAENQNGHDTHSEADDWTSPEEGAAGPETARVARQFAAAFQGGQRFSSIGQARAFAAKILGRAVEPNSADAKMVDEAIEAGVVLAAREIVAEHAGNPQETYRALVVLYGAQPKLAVRTADSIERQAYSTPAPLAFLASTLARISGQTTVLEPTAGTGMLLIAADPERTEANEIDPERRAILEMQGFEPSGVDASKPGTFTPRSVEAVIANPPFGAVREAGGMRRFDMGEIQPGYETGEIDHVIALRALEAMEEEGAAVLILGGLAKTILDPQKRADGYNGKAKREFFLTLYRRYNVVDHFTVAGELYEKQGAGWPVDVIVIRGRGQSAMKVPSLGAPRVLSSWQALESLFDERYEDRSPVAPGGARDGLAPAGDGPRAGGRGPAPRDDQGGQPDAQGVSPAPDGQGGVDGGAGGRARGGNPRPASGTGSPGPVAGGPPPGSGDSGGTGAGAAGGQPRVAGLSEPRDGAAGRAADAPADDAGGGRGRAGYDARGVDEPRVPAGDGPDLNALFDDVLNEEFGPAEVAQNATSGGKLGQDAEKTSENRASPLEEKRPTSRVAASAAANTGRSIADIAAALESILIPQDRNKLGSLPVFDPEQYKRVLPLLREAVSHFREAWGDVKELMRRAVQALGQAVPAERRRAFVESLRAYITRFAGDVQAGREKLGEQQQEAAPAPTERKHRDGPKDEETSRQVAYEPRADAPGVGTLVPVNMRTAVQQALARAEEDAGKPLVDFVAERLDYTPGQVREFFSAEQIDALALGIVNLDRGAGFVIGDQTGVGKGRFVAGMIRYALAKRLIPVFVTEKPNLYADMARDLTDIGMADALARILPTNGGLNLPLNDEKNAPRLKTPDAARHNLHLGSLGADALRDDGRIVFTTYSQAQQIGGADTPRIRFLEAIAPRSFIILDEAHNAGGAGKQGEVGEKINEKKGRRDRGTIFRTLLRQAASAVYSSATWAKRPDVMDLYGIKTDMRLAVASLDQLAAAISRGGVPMQQIVSAMLADAGQYIRRERSFAGVTYDLEPIEVNKAAYDAIAGVMQRIFRVSKFVKKAAKTRSEDMRAEAKAIAPDASVGDIGAQSTAFGAVMHNLINQLLLASKTHGTVRLALAALRDEKKPVIALANTMGSFIEEFAEESGAAPGDTLALNFNSLLNRYLARTLRLTIRKPFAKKDDTEVIWLTPEELGSEGEALYRATEKIIEGLDLKAFPVSPIDFMRAELAKAGFKVGEITGRTETVDYRADGSVTYRRRSASETSIKGRLATISGFNSGAIDVIILNQSGATGLSLHASEKFKDQRKRQMLIAQAEANIDTHMQMLGRVHRTGQVVTPAYLQLVADVPAEKRPAAVLAKKMASLAASTTSNRKGALGAEDSPDFLNEYGDQIVVRILEGDPDLYRALGEPKLRDEETDSIDDAARRATGYIPLLPLKQQEEFYGRIEEEYRRAIEIADEEGTNALEAKTLDLDARLIEERPWTQAKTLESTSQFAANSTAGLYDAKRIIPPTPPAVIFARIAASLGPDRVPAALLAVSDEDQVPGRLSALQRLADDWRDDQLTAVEGAARRALAALEDEALSDKERERAEQRIQAQRDRIRTVLNEAAPASFVGVLEDGIERTALVLSISPPKRGNPNAPGAWEVVMLLQSGQRMTVSLASIFTPENRPQDDDALGGKLVVRNVSAGVSPADFMQQLEEGAKGRREERWIVTGNLLAAYAKRPGQIINFTDAEGEIRQGIILPTGFDMEAFEREQLPRFMWDEAAAYLLDPGVPLTAALIETQDGSVQIARMENGNYVMRVPSSKKDGADWFLDPRLRAVVASDFVGRGDRMNATIVPSMLRRVLEVVGLISIKKRQDLVSKATEAKAWKAAKAGSGGVALYANPFDPALFMRLLGRPVWQAVLKASTALRNENVRLVRRLWGDAPLPPGVVVDDRRGAARDMAPVLSKLRLPNRMFRRWPALAALVDQGIRAEERMSVWSTRMANTLDRILGNLATAKGDLEKVQTALLAADADEVDISDPAIAATHYGEHGLTLAERAAAARINRLLIQAARLVDQHRRAMMPKVMQRKAKVWQSMRAILDSATVKSEEYAAAYRRRTYLARRIRDGKGDLKAQAAEVEQINARLGAMRAVDPDLQERLDKLREEYDALEARLAATSVRRRVGYFPHKFFGSWRLFVVEGRDEETGEPTRTEITSDQGFYSSKGDAIAAARAYLSENPGAALVIEPKVTTFPGGATGTVLSDKSYAMLRAGLEKAAGLEGQDLTDALSGVARRRTRRRTFSPGMLRTGAEGFSRDLERVMRTHIAQSVRYVEMDKLKFAYVTTTEAMGMSPARAVSARMEGKEEVMRAAEAWWRDVNGSKQPGESQLDGALTKMGLPGSTLAAFALGAAVGGGTASPVLAAVLGGYLGARMYSSLKKGGDFPTRTLMGDISSDLAHLKLGMLVNIASAVVNLTQTLINTYPVLGAKWAAEGVRRAAPALLSQARNSATPGKMSADAILLSRANVRTRFSIAQDAPPLLVEDRSTMDAIKRLSMLPFTTMETTNRAVAFLGALARAEDAGKNPAEAMKEAQDVLRRTQFHQGMAARPEILRDHLLRLPTQFKNFVAQQVGFAMGLKGAEVYRFLAVLVLLAGLLGLPALGWLDELVKFATGSSPVTAFKDAMLRAGSLGEMTGTAADVLTRGLPSLLGIDISGRVGMGMGFLPESGSDLAGPAISTAGALRNLGRMGGEIVDYLHALTPAANPLRVLEAAANGATIDSARFWTGGVFGDGRSSMRNPRMRGATEYSPTDGELVAQGLGFRPLRAAQLADAREAATEARNEGRKDAAYWLGQMVQAKRNGEEGAIGRLAADARAAGVRLSPQQIRTALEGITLDRDMRDIRRAPLAQRPDMLERRRAIEGRAQ